MCTEISRTTENYNHRRKSKGKASERNFYYGSRGQGHRSSCLIVASITDVYSPFARIIVFPVLVGIVLNLVGCAFFLCAVPMQFNPILLENWLIRLDLERRDCFSGNIRCSLKDSEISYRKSSRDLLSKSAFEYTVYLFFSDF